MAKAPKAKVDQKAVAEVELVEDAWPRFEALVKSAAKMGHKPHAEGKQKPTRRKS